MASVVNWQQQSVDCFLDQVNWLGRVVAIPSAVETQDWLGLSVQQFWQDCNWDGQRAAQAIIWGTPSGSPAEELGDRPWLAWSVTQFMTAVNWTGLAPVPVEHPPDTTLGVSKVLPRSWQQLSLTDFFERVNWLGKPEEIQLLPGMQSPLRLTVAQFCQAVAWDGKAVIAAVNVPPPKPEPEPEPLMTLDSLSGLF